MHCLAYLDDETHMTSV